MFVTVQNPITTDAVKRHQEPGRTRTSDANEPRRLTDGRVRLQPRRQAGRRPPTSGRASTSPSSSAELTGADHDHRVRPRQATGHTVLPVLACKELVMSKDGGARPDRRRGRGRRSTSEKAAYRRTREGQPRRRFAVVQKMFDPRVKLREGPRPPGPAACIYVDDRRTRGGREHRRDIDAGAGGVQDGQLGLYTAATAQELGLRKAAAPNRAGGRRVYGLPRQLRDDPLGGPHPGRVPVDPQGRRGRRDARVASTASSATCASKKGNVLILVLKCGGHRPRRRPRAGRRPASRRRRGRGPR